MMPSIDTPCVMLRVMVTVAAWCAARRSSQRVHGIARVPINNVLSACVTEPGHLTCCACARNSNVDARS